MTEAEIKVDNYYRTQHDGVVRVDGHFWEGKGPDRHKVYFTRKSTDGTSYQFMACEFTGIATEKEWRA